MDEDLEARTATLRQALGPLVLEDEALLRTLADATTVHRYSAGTMVFEKGSSPEALYVVASGAVAIVATVRGHETEVALIHPGDFFGELAYALDIPRTRAAKVTEDAELMEIPETAIRQAMAGDPGFASRLMVEFEARLPGREHSVE